jgi:DNA-binding CsgD family transcriptional regulator
MPSQTSIRLFCCLFFSWLTISSVLAQSFLQRVERATPPERVRLALYYFDTCRAVTTQQAVATKTLNELDAIGKRQRDDQLRRYARMLRDTYAKNLPNRTHRQNAELFLKVAKQAVADEDEQIAGVCEHFAGQYFYLAEDYGRAFEYLLSANNRFQQIGYDRIPEIHRYLYELAFNYYYLREDDKVIALLTEAARYPPFNPNLHIQTYNTLAMSYGRFHKPETDRQAGANFQKAYKLAMSYGDSVWMGIVRGNLSDTHMRQGQWQLALEALRTDYRLVMRTARQTGYPLSSAAAMAKMFYELGQLDSCRYYLEQAKRMHRLQVELPDYSKSFQDDLFWQRYYETARLYYQRVGNLSLVTRCTDSLLVYEARIDKRYRSRAALLAEQRLLVQQHQAEVEKLHKGSLTQRLWLGLGVGLALLVAGLLGLLYRTSQRRRQQETRTHTEREHQLEAEKQQATAERDQARADLNRFLESLHQAEVPRTTKLPAEPSLTSARLLTDNDWQLFRDHFDRVYPDFFWQLNQQLTSLSPAEERLMALAKLKLHSRQMSQMLGISTESIRKSKYRLRKKFGLAGESPLLDLLVESE